MDLIRVFNLSKFYHHGKRKITILNSNNFVICEGEFVVVLGKSSSGKSTLLKIISGIEKPSSGEYHFKGENIENWSKSELDIWQKTNFGIITDNNIFLENLTLIENIALPLIFRGITKTTRLTRAKSSMKNFGLSDLMFSFSNGLSTSEKQKASFARALITNPKIIVADEPTTGLDKDDSQDMIKFLSRLNREHNTTIILATHNADYTKYADRIIYLHGGHISMEHKKDK